MADSTQISALRRQISRVEQPRPQGPDPVPLGHAPIDTVLGGGMMPGCLHEVYAASVDDIGSAAGFAAMLALRMAPAGGTLLWLRERKAQGRGGGLYAPGLMEIGQDPSRIILGVIDDALGLLKVAGEAVRCPGIAIVIIELWRMPRALDLTATRRLALGTQRSGVTAIILRADAEPMPSAAQTRWSVAAAPSIPLEARAPGYPALDIELLRQRGGGAEGKWRVEWNRDQAVFRPVSGDVGTPAALPGAVVPFPAGGSLAA